MWEKDVPGLLLRPKMVPGKTNSKEAGGIINMGQKELEGWKTFFFPLVATPTACGSSQARE